MRLNDFYKGSDSLFSNINYAKGFFCGKLILLNRLIMLNFCVTIL